MSVEPARPGPAAAGGGVPGDDRVLDDAVDAIADAAEGHVSRTRLREAALRAMVRELGDPWARYYPPQEFADFTAWLAGEGKVVDPEPETGDVSVLRQSDLTVIRVAVFTRGVGQRVREGVTGSHAVMLDLRGNPGGLLTEAVDTASAFLAEGPVVTYDGNGTDPEVITVTSPGDARIPVVVLVDQGTASAAEVVAGSLRDRDRAVLVGSPTFGKGTVQEPVRLPDGSAVELTVGRYETPDGHNLEGTGVEPDVAAEESDAEERARTVLAGLSGA
ncbi:S41 family peptidase [Actinocorallia herbida]|nr:S41 family peptidase [Actinocorallia herbida]